MDPVTGAILAKAAGGIFGWLNNRNEAKNYEKAGNRAGDDALGAFNYLQGSPIGQQYLPGGGEAFSMAGSLLGAGGSASAGGLGAYKNYLNSVGYQHQMKSGQQAITGSAAARGLLGSGSTAKALTRYGQDISTQNFNNYLGHLMNLSGQGLQAGGMIGSAAMQGYSDRARYHYMGDTGSAATGAQGWDQLIGGLGGAYDSWRLGRTPSQPAATDPSDYYNWRFGGQAGQSA